MKAVVLPKVGGKLEVVERPDPVATGQQEIIQVTACGVCHSDLHVVDGDYGDQTPIILGHEVVGIHSKLGPVMLFAPWGCGDCLECATGQQQICSNATEAGLVVDGGYAEQLVVPHIDYLAPLGDLDPVKVAPLACGGLTAYRAVSHGLPEARQKGAKAIVIGAGGLGQYAIRYLRLLSDAEVTVVDLDPQKRQQALARGAHHAVAPEEVEGKYDFIVDFVGAGPTLTMGRDHIHKGGRVVVVGLFGGDIPFGFGKVPHEAIFQTSVWGSPKQMVELLDLARREDILVPVETLPLASAQEAHNRLRSGDVAGRLVLTI
jgi:propanol-preferring alcohol dehydrogenase